MSKMQLVHSRRRTADIQEYFGYYIKMFKGFVIEDTKSIHDFKASQRFAEEDYAEVNIKVSKLNRYLTF